MRIGAALHTVGRGLSMMVAQNTGKDLSTPARLGLLLAAGVLAAGVFLFLSRPTVRGGAVGPLSTSCQELPEFVRQKDIKNAAFDTSRRGVDGLVMYDADNPQTYFQLPGWKQFGSLGPIATDEAGNIYTAPVPNINTLNNPPQEQNDIYVVDAASGEMSLYYTLQDVPLPDQKNPYGILSLAYDCETKVLYASTVSGSAEGQPRGSIIAIDTTVKQEIGRLSGVDAISAGLFRDERGAGLYFGMAGRSEVWRVGLAKDGKLVGRPQKAFGYDKFNELKPRKLVFSSTPQGQQLQIHTTEFRYNLIASTEFRQEYIDFRYDEDSDSWQKLAE